MDDADDVYEDKGCAYMFSAATVQLQPEIRHHFVELDIGTVLCMLNAAQSGKHLQQVAHLLFINIGTQHVCQDNKIACTQILVASINTRSTYTGLKIKSIKLRVFRLGNEIQGLSGFVLISI